MTRLQTISGAVDDPLWRLLASDACATTKRCIFRVTLTDDAAGHWTGPKPHVRLGPRAFARSITADDVLLVARPLREACLA